MKKYIYMAVAAVAVLSSCSGESASEEMKVSGGKVETFTATIDGEGTRTVLGTDRKVTWVTGDVITVSGVEYKAKAGGSTTASFEKNGTAVAEKNNDYTAYYPATLYNSGNPTLPAEYTYDASASYLPMYAYSTTTDLTFKNICGVLAITIPSGTTVKKIVVSAPDKALSGAFEVKEKTTGEKDYYAELTEEAQTAKQPVTLSLGDEAVTLAAATTYYIPVPAQTYGGLRIKVYAADDSEPTQYMATTNPSITIARNTIYPMSYVPNAVQLWAGGPFWATTNVGATSSTDAGLYFTWGGVTGQTWNGVKFSGAGFPHSAPEVEIDDNKLKPAYDAAAQNWGTGWSMPTNTDFTNLLNSTYTSIEEVYEESDYWEEYKICGILVSGKNTGYTSNSIFLPVTGYGNGNSPDKEEEIGYYWSSVVQTSSPYYLAYYLEFCPDGSEDFRVAYQNTYCGCPVRPVRSSL